MRGAKLYLELRWMICKNRWNGKGRKRALLQDTVLCLLSLGLATLLFFSLKESLKSGEVPKELALYGFLCFYFVTLLVSSTVNAIGGLFSSRDLDLMLSLPLKRTEFITLKILEVSGSSFWLLPVFGIPSLLAWHSVSEGTFLLSVLVLLALSVTAILCGIGSALLLGALLPLKHIKEAIVALLAALFLAILLHVERLATLQRYKDSHSSEKMLQALHFQWPPAWAESAIRDSSPSAVSTLLTFSFSILCFGILYLLWIAVYELALTRCCDSRGWLKPQSRFGQRISKAALSMISQQTRAFLTKELKGFSRDMIQSIHFMLLLGTCVIYLYNLDVLASMDKLREELKPMWSGFLALCNIMYGSLIVTAITARFVFPSLSLEGESFWLVQTAPVSLKDLLRIRLRIWCLPLSIVATVIFSSGACAVGAPLVTVLLSALAGPILSYGIIGVGVGLGAIFTDFDSDHAGQHQASLKGLAFVAASTLLSVISLIPLSIGILVSSFDVEHLVMSSRYQIAIAVATIPILLLIQWAASALALRSGEAHLRKQLA